MLYQQFGKKKTYYNYGFFNVPIEYDARFGKDMDKIDIHFGNEEKWIGGYINRTANKNKTPRIMGGVDLRNWLQNTFTVNDRVQIEILSPTSISISNSKELLS